MITTKRGLVRAVRKAMERQKWRRAASPHGGCLYRKTPQTGCAIGCLIPAAKYKPEFEDVGSLARADALSISINPTGQRAILKAAGIAESLRAEARQLQIAHDNAISSADWKARFEAWART